MPLSKKQLWKEVHYMSMTTKISKILTNFDGAILENVPHLTDWLHDFLVCFLFICFYPISSTSLLSNNIPVDQWSFWGSNNYWLQFKGKTNWELFIGLHSCYWPSCCTHGKLLINCMCSSSQLVCVQSIVRFEEEEERFEVEHFNVFCLKIMATPTTNHQCNIGSFSEVNI